MPGQLSNQIPSSVRTVLEQDSDGGPVNLSSAEVSEKTYVYTSILGED